MMMMNLDEDTVKGEDVGKQKAVGAMEEQRSDHGLLPLDDRAARYSVDSQQHAAKLVKRGALAKIFFQIRLLLWKRYVEQTKTKWDLLKVVLPAMLIFTLLILIYVVFDFFADGGVEPMFVPFAFWIFMQRLVVTIMYEKSTRLQESMRMMGLSDFAYWVSYFISDGILLGFFLSFICTLFTTYGLFNGANFGTILGLLFSFCLAAVPFGFFLTSFFDTPQTSGQATLGILFGFYIVYIVVFVAHTGDMDEKAAQRICCLFPPLALQIGAGSFLKSYKGIDISEICGLLFADVFIYALAAWYFSQVWPSKVGVAKPWYFPLKPSYWLPAPNYRADDISGIVQLQQQQMKSPTGDAGAAAEAAEAGSAGAEAEIPEEEVDEKLLGAPTVVVNKLRRTFGSQVAVNDLSFKMYENQIFALLGHNGAGKTTTISMMTGLIAPDWSFGNVGASIYGKNVLSDMEQIRYSMGVCPQHDVLFENLSVREHILFFAQLKGTSYEDADSESTSLTSLFHLEERLDHMGHELSGGQKRKLSVAIAVCGGSKFVVLDEPTAGMDPLARRELWDLLSSLRKGRTMLLTTHYMDEADILGDRVGIMSLGKMQCMGTTQFLKTTYGAGYKLVFDKADAFNADQLNNLTSFVQGYIPEATFFEEDGSEAQVLYSLPFNTVDKFGNFFTKLESSIDSLHVTNFGVNITSLEDVFLRVGEDHTVTPNLSNPYGIGADRSYNSNFHSQVLGIMWRKLSYALNDFITIPLLLLPVTVAVTAAALYQQQVIADDDFINNLVIAGMYVGAYLGAPGLIAEFLVRERSQKLRNVLTVMGCGFEAYWLGTFIADYLIMSIPLGVIYISWVIANMTDFSESDNGENFFIFMIFNFQLVAFSYFFSYMFSSPKACITLMPVIILLLMITPNIILLIIIEIADSSGQSIDQDVQGGILLWGFMILSPHGALFSTLLDTTQDYSNFISSYPPSGASIGFMVTEGVIFLLTAYFIDAQSVAKISAQDDASFDATKALEGLDQDVIDERARTLNANNNEPLRIERLRKVFPPKRVNGKPVVAVEEACFTVGSGEIFGLLGANGAGKTTALSMLTRHLVPTAGDAFIAGHSILSDFSKGSTHLGVVTQNNSLWDKLSVQGHLFLFARLRGVPEDLVKQVVDGVIDQLELTPHRYKLAMRLSGGMKRKLCVAIALIGDPEVVLLDEPSAGLDPVSRRNLWSVILRTMSHRAVILTTHSMDEAEALCKRIGIMVQGQLRALGTKQHLKTKFGSGFELVVKFHVTDLQKQMHDITGFVTRLFKSAKLISENGGLLTYRIPKEEMKMGVAFTELQANKRDLCIEDYTIAQPTLEQVFIRTVNKHTPGGDRSNSTSSPLVVGGGSRLSGRDVTGADATDEEFVGDALIDEVNYCGCTDRFMKIYIVVTAVLCVVFIAAGVGSGRANPSASGALWTLGIIFLVASIVGCNMLYCACCRAPKGTDE